MNVRAVVELLRERLGLDPAALGSTTVEQAVVARMRLCGVEDAFAYAGLLAADAQEFQALAEEVSVPETWFFRGGFDLFAHLAAIVRDALSTNPARPPFRILSAPCSSGEEPYSLAIALAEAGVAPSAWTMEGIDFSSRALEKARAGRYRAFSFRQTDAELRARYFRALENDWEIAPAMREQVRFRQGNLSEPLAAEPQYDLIFCRNLLIYLHEAARGQVLANLDRLLAPEGILCTGPAEPVSRMDGRFELLDVEPFCLYRRAGSVGERRGVSPPWTGQPQQLHYPRQAYAAPLANHAPGPEGPDPLTHARQLADAGKIDQGLALCTAHLQNAGPSAGAYALSGILRQALHEDDEAVRCYERALYLDPRHVEALTHLMLLCRKRGELDRAEILRRRLQESQSRGEA
jgi:chemotaxis protein methyltransferase WspC